MSTVIKRRQKHSCEQCRKSKKACDGYLVNLRSGPVTALQPCSYCVNTRKECSLNSKWSIKDPEHCAIAASLSENAESSVNHQHLPATRIPTQIWPVVPVSKPDYGQVAGLAEKASGNLDSRPSSNHGPNVPILDNLFTGGLPPDLAHSATSQISSVTSQSSPNVERLGSITSESLDSQLSSSNSTSLVADPTAYALAKKRKRRMQSSTALTHEKAGTSISSYEPSHGLMESCNRRLITESFLQIYSDVLENHLTCLLNEQICPYKTWLGPYPQVAPVEEKTTALSEQGQPDESAFKEETSWSNQVYRRVKDLEQAAQRTTLVHLTREENQMAARALTATIMAYSAQWSQGSQRNKPTEAEPPNDILNDFPGDEFEQHLQLALWQSAKRALEKAAGIESFRLVFAEIVFGFTQKPSSLLDPVDPPPLDPTGASKAFFLHQAQKYLDEEDSAVYIRRAIVKMYALKTRFDLLRVVAIQNADPTWLSQEQSGTVGLIYWFVVMIDKVLSTVSPAPPIIADEDCQGQSLASPESALEVYPESNPKWDLNFFAHDDPHNPRILRWPCPYNEAIDAVTRAASVKILLFRYTSYLKEALRQGLDCVTIEEIITGAMETSNYWQKTHGALFRDFVDSYSSLPTRLKSWFPFVSVHWHLASLILADLVDFIDQNGRGSEEGRISRSEAQITARMRKVGAAELSELAWVTTPHDQTTESREQLPSYHFAVSDGPSLTEPWTMLLVKALSKAIVFYLGLIEGDGALSYSQGVDGQWQGYLQQAKACVHALGFMGRRSSSAQSLYIVFNKWIGRIEGHTKVLR